ncbi:MAG TPA: SAM-dependent methyltransferase [Desulfofustis sp.]|nr:SAM-dependent methyltransferase [Desulfofustis sp.]HBH31945.1 SAM-dependent methyltransferase [Desulfofustis sp.]
MYFKVNNPVPHLSRDTLFAERLIYYQYRSGYRFSLDSVMLAHFPEIRGRHRVLDIGAGGGILGLILLYRHQSAIERVTGVEVQPELAELARLNIRVNGYMNQFEVITGSVTDHLGLCEKKCYSLVVCNPPYYQIGDGRNSGNRQRLRATRRLDSSLHSFVAAARSTLCIDGAAYFIYPAHLVMELCEVLKRHDVSVFRQQFIYPYPEAMNPVRVLIGATRRATVTAITHPPRYLYTRRGGEECHWLHRCYQP